MGRVSWIDHFPEAIGAFRFLVYAEVLALAEVGAIRRLGQIREGQQSVPIDYRDLENNVVDVFLRPLDVGGKCLPIPVPFAARIEEEFVDAFDC
jgi:hypothetical protein